MDLRMRRRNVLATLAAGVVPVGGCIGGGGQPRVTDQAVRQARIDGIFREDEGKEYRKSHDNPEIKQLYEEFLSEPLGHKSHELLHTE